MCVLELYHSLNMKVTLSLQRTLLHKEVCIYNTPNINQFKNNSYFCRSNCKFKNMNRIICKYNTFVVLLFSAFMTACISDDCLLEQSMQLAGENRSELEKVLQYYKNDPEKLSASRFLIENMPAHYSYKGRDIIKYYDYAKTLFQSGLSPKEQSDSLIHISNDLFPNLDADTISDVKIIKSDFLIKNIDMAFDEWKNRPWAKHLTFDEFCEWLLPYKVVELQEMDAWRDTLSSVFTWGLNNMIHDDDTYETTVNAANTIRNEILWRIHPFGVYGEKGYPFLSANTLPYFTFGNCKDYVTVAVLTYRSVGIPCIIDETPFWGRYRAGHSWYTILNNRGEELTSEWDISSMPGGLFFIDKRIPKVFRNTYAINQLRKKYLQESSYKYPFNVCQQDITSEYFNTSDLEVPIFNDFKPTEKYVYIASFTGNKTDWSIVDYGILKDGKAFFKDMGRNVLYIALGYDGRSLCPISKPFILHTDGQMEYIIPDNSHKRTVNIRRKYYQSRNVLTMRNRILYGKIQGANMKDFSDSITIYEIKDVYVPDKIQLEGETKYRYWRYLSPSGSHGNIAELSFFDLNDSIVNGRIISNIDDNNIINKVFDGDRLSFFDTYEPDGNWVGMDMGKIIDIASVRIVPRSDDNDIRPDDTYELFYWSNDNKWISCGIRKADSNVLSYSNIPKGALMWVRDYTRGLDERPFLIDDAGNVEWW